MDMVKTMNISFKVLSICIIVASVSLCSRCAFSQSSGPTPPPPPVCSQSILGQLYTDTTTQQVYSCNYYNLTWQWVAIPTNGGLTSQQAAPGTCSGPLPVFVTGWPNTNLDVCINGVPTPLASLGTLTLTTSGTSGPATLSGGTLNIPQYSGGAGTVIASPQFQVPYYTQSGSVAQVGGNANFTTDASGNVKATSFSAGSLPSNHVTIGALGTPTAWNFDTTTPATALASLGGASAQFLIPTVSYGAAGIGVVTLGSCTAGSNLLTVFNVGRWIAGEPITVLGAGSSGANHVTTVSSISGNIFTLSANCLTTVASVQVFDSGTTGSCSSSVSPTLLTVANAATWAATTPGQGIDIAGAGAAGADQINTVTNVSGTTLTLASPCLTTVSNAAVNHDDTAALQAAINDSIAGKGTVHLTPGAYNITSALTVSSPGLNLVGDGWSNSIIMNRGRTNDQFRVSYGIPPASFNTDPTFTHLDNAAVIQMPGITPTAGAAFNIGNATNPTFNLIISNFLIQGTCGGIYEHDNHGLNFFKTIRINSQACSHATVGGGGIYQEFTSYSGDEDFNDVSLRDGNGSNTTVYIGASDTETFTNLKVVASGSGSDLTFGDEGPYSRVIRFVSASLEGPINCGIDLGPGGGNSPWAAIFSSTEFGGTTDVCHPNSFPISFSSSADLGSNALYSFGAPSPGFTLNYPAGIKVPMPIAGWNITDAAGTTAADLTGQGNNLALTAATWSGYTAPLRNSLTFNGSTAVAVAANNTNTNFDQSTTFSISAWVNIPTQFNSGTLLSTEDFASSQIGYDITLFDHAASGNCPAGTGQCVSFSLVHSVSPVNYIYVEQSSGAFSAAGWHFIVVTYDGSSAAAGVKIYIDGVQQTTVIGSNTLTGATTNTKAVTIGQRTNASNPLPNNVLVGPVMIWPHLQLTWAQVQTLYANPYLF